MSAEENNTNEQDNRIQVSVDPALDYSYRDFFNIFVGPEDVTIDFGNRQRGRANNATVYNHLVLSLPNAIRLQQGLARSIEEARTRMQQAREEAQKNAQGSN